MFPRRKGFNRTLLELKLYSVADNLLATGSFNRTLLELKLFLCVFPMGKAHCFNRTLLELKLLCCRRRREAPCALIEPYWN